MKTSVKISAGFGVVLLMGLGIVISPTRVGAEASCAFDLEAKELEAIDKNFELGYSEKLSQELEVRKTILRKIVGCGIDEANKLKEELEGISYNSGVEQLRNRFDLELDQAINYYKINGSGIDDLDLIESKNLARKFLDWRINNYRYTTGGVINLITWVSNQNFFKVAESRFGQVEKAMGIIDTAYDPENKIRLALGEARVSLDKAKNSNLEAKQMLKGYSPPEKTLELIKTSLELIREMYQGFFKISEIINNLRQAPAPETKN